MYYQTAGDAFRVMLNQLERDKKRIDISDDVYKRIVACAQEALNKVGEDAHVRVLLRELRKDTRKKR